MFLQLVQAILEVLQARNQVFAIFHATPMEGQQDQALPPLNPHAMLRLCSDLRPEVHFSLRNTT